MTTEQRTANNERFLKRLLARHPEAIDRHADLVRSRVPQTESMQVQRALESRPVLETLEDPQLLSTRDRVQVLETIVSRERPVLFVQNGKFNTTDVTSLGVEAAELVDLMKRRSDQLLPRLPLVGRFDVTNFPGSDFLGTGWFVAPDVVVTNRHVAELVALHDGRQFRFRRGVGGAAMAATLCNAHEYDDADPTADRQFAVTEVLYIEPERGPDIAFVRVRRTPSGAAPAFIEIAPADASENDQVCVIGYPARAPRRVIPDQQLMNDLYRNRFDVKRAAPGYSLGTANGSSEHDCTTLGGNSGSVVVNFAGQAVGLHFAGLYQEANYAVPASVLRDYVRRERWRPPSEAIDLSPPVPPTPPAKTNSAPVQLQATVPAGGHQLTVTIPLTLTISLGELQVTSQPPITSQPTGSSAPADPARVEAAANEYWATANKAEVLAARVGFDDDGDRPFLAVSVAPTHWADYQAKAPKEFRGVPVRYLPATLDEQAEAVLALESVDSISYDDDARTAKKFSFDPVEDEMEILLHVGPEYSWSTLKEFLDGAKRELVSAMYEFHADHIMEAIEGRLDEDIEMKLVLDNATFHGESEGDGVFDRPTVFKKWANRYSFERIVAPEGRAGLISDSYHIKVTVRDGNSFWLSSGNWKAGSSQPPITQDQLDDATDRDLPGNREWHVVIKNKTLASRYRSHIVQDFARSEELNGGPLPVSRRDETLLEVPALEAPVLERRAPSKVIKPKTLKKVVRVKPLLTPDKEGAVYSEAVLELIRSARESLLFQIPYIGMPPSPSANRGFIDELINALVDKLKTLRDARVILRTGGNRFSSPTHAAWFFKSKGVDIGNRLRAIGNHHTKGMIVDGQRLLIGSHNWSKPGVSLNRDASLLFDDADVAAYYAEAFEVDWQRANPIRPKRAEAVVREAAGGEFRRIQMADWLADD